MFHIMNKPFSIFNHTTIFAAFFAFVLFAIINSCKKEPDESEMPATESVASLTTIAAGNITESSATSGGVIGSEGSSSIIRRGVCWDTNEYPTIEDDTTWNGSGTGTFTSVLSGLNANTTYYIRAYAITSTGASYGNQVNFTTCETCGNCYDGIQNNSETFIDCGGPNCMPCGHCVNGVFEPELGELWVDCGGECPVCPTCANGILDDGETGIDCGGTCASCESLCGDGLLNGFEDNIDCENQGDVTLSGCPFCPSCIDGIFNGQEVGIDCGGPDCAPCCSTGNCGNGIQDGQEFFIDCGGNSCPDCEMLLRYYVGSTGYFTPSTALNHPTYNDATGTLTYSLENAYFLNSQTPANGVLSLLITRPLAGWASSVGDQLIVDLTELPTIGDPSQIAIQWTDESGFQYTSALPGGKCLFVLSRYKELNISNSDVANGCNKPVGFYRFFRGTFEGTLVAVDPLAPTPEIELDLGQFQFTFLP
jgi:hypothetical protein